MRCKCLVMDHDDTTVNSTATIHFPSFCAYLQLVRPQAHYTLEEYFRKNFDPGILRSLPGSLGSPTRSWKANSASGRTGCARACRKAYPGIRRF